ncbi:MAG: hypothetical protein IH987_10360 [Planctomycetes bacterium]|nr:hypothetical protein [Planctomycetota bacterium]
MDPRVRHYPEVETRAVKVIGRLLYATRGKACEDAVRIAGPQGDRRATADALLGLADGSVVAGAALTESVGARQGARVTWNGSALNGKALFVLDFEADLYLVADEDRALYLVESKASGLQRQGLTTVDKTRPVGELVFDDVAAEPLEAGSDDDVCARIVDAGRIILAADTLGAAQNMLDQAVAYSKIREQFGRVIGSFQAVKHMCAEMAASLEPCRAMMWYAAYAFDSVPDEARLTACHTKAHLAEDRAAGLYPGAVPDRDCVRNRVGLHKHALRAGRWCHHGIGFLGDLRVRRRARGHRGRAPDRAPDGDRRADDERGHLARRVGVRVRDPVHPRRAHLRVCLERAAGDHQLGRRSPSLRRAAGEVPARADLA